MTQERWRALITQGDAGFYVHWARKSGRGPKLTAEKLPSFVQDYFCVKAGSGQIAEEAKLPKAVLARARALYDKIDTWSEGDKIIVGRGWEMSFYEDTTEF